VIRWSASLAIPAVLGCSQDTEPRVKESCIVGGHAEGEEFASLGQTVVALVDDYKNPASLCSGVFVSPRVLLTASHCRGLLPERFDVVTGSSVSCPERVYPGRFAVLHSSLDIALVEVETKEPNLAFMPWNNDPHLDGIQGTVVIAGFGVSDSGWIGSKLFASTQIVAMTTEYLTTSSTEYSGGCDGDSGGPLFGRNSEGDALVLGILSKGSSSCRGEDHFVRLSHIGAWIGENIE